MKTKEEIQTEIKRIEDQFAHVLNGSCATIDVNAPRALMQISAEKQLDSLHWVLGKKYKSKLKGINR